jgi:hypothetical protein
LSEPRFAALAAAIEDDLQALGALVEEMAELRSRLGDSASSFDRRAAGSILHDFYGAAERIFERVTTELDGGVPAAADWRTSLLRQMSYEVQDQRPAVLGRATADRLDEYLRFRHVFRNVYGSQLQWSRMQSVVDALPAVHSAFAGELGAFAAWLRQLAARA